jgi:hypothetical protein
MQVNRSLTRFPVFLCPKNTPNPKVFVARYGKVGIAFKAKLFQGVFDK